MADSRSASLNGESLADSEVMLICPSFFDGRLDGIGRVSGAFFEALSTINGLPPFVLSANDPGGSCAPDAGVCFGRKYYRMVFTALFGRLNGETVGVSSGRTVERRDGQKIGQPGGRTGSGCSAVVCMHLGPATVARIIARRLRVPYAVFIHGVECWKPLGVRSQWGMRGASLIFCNSKYTVRTFHQHNRWAERIPVRVIPLGVSSGFGEAKPTDNPAASSSVVRPPACHALRTRFQPVGLTGRRVDSTSQRTVALREGGPSVFRILTVGRMSKAEYFSGFRAPADLYKGFKQLIVAVGRVAVAVPGTRLKIVGDGDARLELERWTASQPEAGLVEFAGRVSDDRLRELYAASDVFALPSEGEGFGIVFVEAMAHGLPCVCVSAGAAPEVVEDGVTGLVARPRDVDDLAAKLLQLATDPARRATLGRNGRAQFEARYTAAKFQRRIKEAIADLETFSRPSSHSR